VQNGNERNIYGVDATVSRSKPEPEANKTGRKSDPVSSPYAAGRKVSRRAKEKRSYRRLINSVNKST
jgi:hypothetical protein